MPTGLLSEVEVTSEPPRSRPCRRSRPLLRPVSGPCQVRCQVQSHVPGAGRRSPVAPAGTRCGQCPLLLLTVLGEFVHPRGDIVWTGTLVEALGQLGVEEKSARPALTRTASEGLLSSSREGRRVRWQLTAQGAALLEAGAQRLYGFMRDGVPGTAVGWCSPSRSRRPSDAGHRLRTRLTWLGLGSPTSGLWITPTDTRSKRSTRWFASSVSRSRHSRGSGRRPGSATRAACWRTPGTSRRSRSAIWTSSTGSRTAGPTIRARPSSPRSR